MSGQNGPHQAIEQPRNPWNPENGTNHGHLTKKGYYNGEKISKQIENSKELNQHSKNGPSNKDQKNSH